MVVTVIGGGTGSSAVLNGLKDYPDLDLRVIVSMADDGGSNAVIRDEFGLLPMSDLRKSIIALSQLPNNDKLRKLFTYRFSQGEGLKEHTLGNLMMVAVSGFTSSTQETIDYLREIFRVRHKVIPVTVSDSRLVARYSTGEMIRGEHLIDEPDIPEDAIIEKAWLEPDSEATEEAINSILESDFIIIGPGDLYTTTLASLMVNGIANAIRKSNAKKIFITSLMSKHGQTRGLTQSQIINIIEKSLKTSVDILLINKEELPERVISYYREHGEHLLHDDIKDKGKKIVREMLVADEIFKKDSGDTLVRSIARHDSGKLGWELYKLMKDHIGIVK